jgi:RNA polymerase sigma factor (sigma-70 family)
VQFEEFYEKYVGWVTAVVLHRWRDDVFGNADVEDVIQAAMLAAWQNFGKLRDRQHILNWLRVVACNKSAAQATYNYRRARRNYPLDATLPSPALDIAFEEKTLTYTDIMVDGNAEIPFREIDDTDEVDDSLRVLSSRERQVITLVVDGCSQEDVAYQLGISPSRVGQVMQHARARLEHELLVA